MNVAIAGLGLVGGSMARALARAGVGVTGVDRRAVLAQARRAGVLAATAPDLARAATGADVVVLAAPPETNLRLLEELRGVPVTVTDVTSAKGPIVARAAALGLRHFVGGHPMAGRERGGFARSDADLFRGRAWILTPRRATPAADVRRVERVVRACGARVVHLAPAAHDRAVAHLSHVPQLVAWALAAAAEGDRVAGRHLALAGGGYRDMTRLAASPPELWREILGQNAAEVRRALLAFERALARVRRATDS